MENMTTYPINQHHWFPTHCCLCIQTGIKNPATYLINQGQGTESYFACNSHRHLLEQHGIKALHKKRNPA